MKALVNLLRSRFIGVIYGFVDFVQLVRFYPTTKDDEGLKEIILIYSLQFYETKIEVFKYSCGLAERVGKFEGQLEIHIEDDIISLTIGSQGIANEYIYIRGSFYELVYHNPNEEED